MKDAAELTRGLLRKAKNDRIAMEASLAARALAAAWFHAQQAAEKCLKAFLAYRGVEFPHTYNMAKLIESCAPIDPVFRSLLPKAAPLTPYAVEMRYDESFLRSQQVADEASSSALAIVQFILDRLPKDLRETRD